ncbi:uncharacterized protein L3040_001336 [Drepanopeziza brunnea f. sp. 'multigermtubi']|uniref:uncharacterized protein n=1 Tax=Drepanopeziza brunnea f. sp. 'multigermtubi' TaxID=698441 RepID=UPI00239D8C46|nr:hypothetical protein L3040_001336 [Drepanopeziza brunnea f. sp. 'multigermtubi']
MPLTNAIHESLPYIDSEPTPSERSAALALILAEADALTTTTPANPHPSQPALQPSNLSPLMQAEHARIESQKPLAAITTAHYEELDAPSSPSPNSDKNNNNSKEIETAWLTALSQSATASAHLTHRLANLHLLELYGRPAWLAGNQQLEAVLRALERELEVRKAEIDACVVERRAAQEGVAGELRGLDEAWRRGVGRVLETEVAAEGLRREVLEKRRGGAM